MENSFKAGGLLNMSSHCTISIAKDFSEYVGARYKTLGPYSGEEFRDDHLVPKLKECDKVTIDMNNVFGYGSSFLDEAFGGLIRKKHFTLQELQQKLELVYDNESYITETWGYIKEEAKRQGQL